MVRDMFSVGVVRSCETHTEFTLPRTLGSWGQSKSEQIDSALGSEMFHLFVPRKTWSEWVKCLSTKVNQVTDPPGTNRLRHVTNDVAPICPNKCVPYRGACDEDERIGEETGRWIVEV